MLKGEEHAPGHYAIGFDRPFLSAGYEVRVVAGVATVNRRAEEALREARTITRVLDAWEEARMAGEERTFLGPRRPAAEWADLIMPVYGQAPEPGRVTMVVEMALQVEASKEREACAKELEREDSTELPHWPATAEERAFAWAVRRAAARAMRARAGR